MDYYLTLQDLRDFGRERHTWLSRCARRVLQEGLAGHYSDTLNADSLSAKHFRRIMQELLWRAAFEWLP